MIKGKQDMDISEQLSRTTRRLQRRANRESMRVTAPGTGPAGWTIKITSLSEYNLYNVQQVHIEQPGQLPSNITSSATKAYNMAESFLSVGSVSAGTYAVMWQVGGVNVFYVNP